MCVLPFTPEFMRLPPETFTHTVLVEQLHAAQVVVGENFTYGHRAAGTSRRWPSRDAASASPSRACRWRRTASDGGDGDHLLDLRPGLRGRRATWSRPPARSGRPHRVDGVVVRGDRRGRRPGLPDGERREPAVHRHPGRRRLRGAPGDPRPAQRRQPRAAPGGDLGRHQPHVPGQPAHRRGVRPRLRRRPLRRARRAWSSSQRLRPMAAFADVEACSPPWPRTSRDTRPAQMPAARGRSSACGSLDVDVGRPTCVQRCPRDSNRGPHVTRPGGEPWRSRARSRSRS